jgi:hypothetical protein
MFGGYSTKHFFSILVSMRVDAAFLLAMNPLCSASEIPALTDGVITPGVSLGTSSVTK